MRLYPAVDIKKGQCVRLKQGRFEDVLVYSENPWEIALKWQEFGAEYVHVVDLDGALAGQFVNEKAIDKLVHAVHIPVQTGGGIRTAEDIRKRLTLGVGRVIIGTKAVENPQFIKEVVSEFGADKIVIGIDAKDGMAAVEGWEKVSRYSAVELALQMKQYGVKTIVYTDIAKDGMLSGPNVPYTREMVEKTGMAVIASGGIASMEDLIALQGIGVEGAIIGKALYEERIDLKDAVIKLRERI